MFSSHRNSEIKRNWMNSSYVYCIKMDGIFSRMKMDEGPISITIPSYFDVKTCEHVSTYGTVLVAFDPAAGSCDCGVHGSKKGGVFSNKMQSE